MVVNVTISGKLYFRKLKNEELPIGYNAFRDWTIFLIYDVSFLKYKVKVSVFISTLTVVG